MSRKQNSLLSPRYCFALGVESETCFRCGGPAYANPRRICEVMEIGRLREIPDNAVLAFGCNIESICQEGGVVGQRGYEEPACEKWCHTPGCTVSFTEEFIKANT